MECSIKSDHKFPGQAGSGEPCYPDNKINCNRSVGMLPKTAYNLNNAWIATCYIFKSNVPPKIRDCFFSVGGRDNKAYHIHNIWEPKCHIFKD